LIEKGPADAVISGPALTTAETPTVHSAMVEGGLLIDAAKRFGNADVQKAVQLSKFDSAGVLVPIQQSGEVIEFLRPDAALLKLGMRTQAFKDELHMGKQTGTSVFKWVGEGRPSRRACPSTGRSCSRRIRGWR
jgi:hypothetical protein